MMSLKNKFLSYVELQRAANVSRDAYGPDHPKTADAYMNANELKRQIINMIDELEGEPPSN